MDITPNPARLCPFQPQTVPAIIGGLATGLVCSQRCPLFIVVADAKEKPVDGKCSFTFMAVALVNFEQQQRAMIAVAQAAGGDPSAPAPASA